MSLRDAINAMPDLAHEDVVVPEWGGATVRVRELDGMDQAEWDDESAACAKEPRMRSLARFLLRSLRDPVDGSRLFTDVASVLSRSPKVLVRLFEVAARVNGLGGEEPNGLSPKG